MPTPSKDNQCSSFSCNMLSSNKYLLHTNCCVVGLKDPRIRAVVNVWGHLKGLYWTPPQKCVGPALYNEGLCVESQAKSGVLSLVQKITHHSQHFSSTNLRLNIQSPKLIYFILISGVHRVQP